MESLLPYLLPLLLLPLSLYLVSNLRRKGSNDRKNEPPGSTGWWPILGETREFTSDPHTFVKNRIQKHSSEIFQTSLYGEKMVVFCGQQSNKFVFMNEGKLFKRWLPKSQTDALSHNIGFNSKFKEAWIHTRNLRHDLLKPDTLKQYLPMMDMVARNHLDTDWKLRTDSVVKILPWAKKYTFEINCRLFMGVVDPLSIKKLLDPFVFLSDHLYSLPINFPGTTFTRTIKAGKMVREHMKTIIEGRRKEKREELMEKGDLLSKMLMIDEGEGWSDEEICEKIIGLLVASETSSSAITSTINYLAQLPHIYNEVLKEQMEIVKCKAPDELLSWKDLEKMKYTWNIVRESMRLMSPTHGGFRETTTEFTYSGFTIPKGTKVFWTLYSFHKNPDYFPEPEKFDPSRFEGIGPAPNTYIPFGGGSTMCVGREFARLQLLVCIHYVVTSFKLEKAIPNEKIVYGGSDKPVHGLPVHIHPHKK